MMVERWWRHGAANQYPVAKLTWKAYLGALEAQASVANTDTRAKLQQFGAVGHETNS